MDVPERIRQTYPAMSKALKQFADFVLSKPVATARMSIHAAVQEAGVSVATANRFARTLGFKDYPEFRAELISGFESALAPVTRLAGGISRESSSRGVMVNCLYEDISNVESTIDGLNGNSCDAAVEMILNAEDLLIAGFDNGGALAQILANGLNQTLDKCVASTGHGSGFSGARHLSRMGTSDLLIAIAFPRYMKDTVDLAQAAAARGVPVLAITDSHESPLATHARLSLFVTARREFASVSNAAVLAMIEALLAAVSHRTPGAVPLAEAVTETGLPWIEPSRER